MQPYSQPQFGSSSEEQLHGEVVLVIYVPTMSSNLFAKYQWAKTSEALEN